MTKISSRLLGVLGAAVFLSSVAAFSSVGPCYEDRFGDGYCQQQNNNAECGYDGGDCCECTCVNPSDDDDWRCSSDGSGFACIDPDAPCVEDDDITVEMLENCSMCCLGDGHCDQDNNNEICGYDGGDCCECTCVSPWDDDDDWTCSNRSGFACIDPAAPCVDDDDITAVIVENCGYLRGIGDGWCQEENNNELCGYDGGDCCECTCVDSPEDDDEAAYWDDDGYADCGGSFACIDPNAACVNDDDITVDIDDNCDTASMGDARCDMDNNNEACAYDGGDCCECTCEDTPNNTCGNWAFYRDFFFCIDPEAPCVDDDSYTVDMLENCAQPLSFGDGVCNQGNNNDLCGYDGGDCCECTCEGNDWGCRKFACIDPNAPCVDDDIVTVDMLENCDDAEEIGDGYCSSDLNTPECAYDGGDCCSCTCQNDFDNDEACTRFACIDPEAACVNDDDITADIFDDCSDPLAVGDGGCDEGNNNEACGYDGGDCCSCTCYERDAYCSESNIFDCKDPSASCFEEETTGSDDYDFTFDDDDQPMSYEFVTWEETESLPAVTDAVEAGTKTEVGVSATAHDVRPGSSSGDVGCGEVGGLGCTPTNTRDGIASDIESRWSCATSLVPDEGPCQIEFSFAEPQNIVDIQVAFWKGNERTRTLEVHVNGELTHTHESYTDSIFNTLGVTATDVSTVMLESVALSDEWISLLEVLIFVTL